MSYKIHFSRFLNAKPGRLHFAAHSHHPWPDVSFEAHQQAWLDAAALADLKWDKVFGEILPKAQTHVAHALKLPDPRTVCFAPSTHELVMRLISSIDRRPLRVLTTDGEFHSFSRQMRRYEEDGHAHITRIAVEPFASFAERFCTQAHRTAHDLVYVSQCFYNSGFRVTDLETLVASVGNPQTPIVIDGYHGYMAVPTDLSALAHRVFYTAGGYKYAMSGEGVCFMHCPPGYAERPLDTGWFAGFSGLSGRNEAVPYAQDGTRFLGATFDPSGLYRFNAVMDWLQRLDISVAQIHQRAVQLQELFLQQRAASGLLPGAELIPPQSLPRGNFLTFRHPQAGTWHRRLLNQNVVTDCREDRLRIGFGLYHDAEDITQLAERMAQALTG